MSEFSLGQTNMHDTVFEELGLYGMEEKEQHQGRSGAAVKEMSCSQQSQQDIQNMHTMTGLGETDDIMQQLELWCQEQIEDWARRAMHAQQEREKAEQEE